MNEGRKAIIQFSNISRLLYGMVGLCITIVFFMVIFDNRADKTMEKALSAQMQNQDIFINIVHLDEVLTMSASMSAATGDRKWKERYLHYQPLLEKNINEAIQLYPQAYLQADAKKIKTANDKLVELEKQVLHFSEASNQTAALKIINSREYTKQKEIYSSALKTFAHMAKKDASLMLAGANEDLHNRLLLLLPTIVLMIICGFFIRQCRLLLAYQIKVETELTIHRNQLQTLVDEQTHSLREAMESAEQANQLKSEFLANVTHELKTPVHCIINFAQIGMADVIFDKHERLKDHFEDIYSNGLRLDALISDLLDFSKIEAGGMDFQLDMYAIRPLVKNAVAFTRAMAEQKQLQISIAETGVDEPVIVDARRMEQVLINLMSNAIRLSPTGGQINWSFTPEKIMICDSNITIPALAIIIEDQGPGIPEEDLEQIFNHFVQSEAAIYKGGGTGLGLTICRRFLQVFHGTISASNRESGGAAFKIILPLWHRIPHPISNHRS